MAKYGLNNDKCIWLILTNYNYNYNIFYLFGIYITLSYWTVLKTSMFRWWIYFYYHYFYHDHYSIRIITIIVIINITKLLLSKQTKELAFYLELIFDIFVDRRKDLFSYYYLLLLPGFSLVEINVIYMHMIFTTEGLPEVAIENWPERD